MAPSSLFVLALFCFFASTFAFEFGFETRAFPVEAIVKARCSLDETEETVFFFNGTIAAYPDQAVGPVSIIFKTVGMNVARCFRLADGTYRLVGRELLYYLDPTTEEVIHRWRNPWTNEVVPVAHVANDPVTQLFNQGSFNMTILGGATIIPIDVPLRYPNTLRSNATYFPYGNQYWYQAGEFFKFIVPTIEVQSFLDPYGLKQTSYSHVSWTRTGPWLPWMKQENRTGYLMYSSQGSKVDDWTKLPEYIKTELATRIPWYKHAPTCYPSITQVTSWSYFQRYLPNYLAGDRFPIAEQNVYGCAP